jgi:hypothetical protein
VIFEPGFVKACVIRSDAPNPLPKKLAEYRWDEEKVTNDVQIPECRSQYEPIEFCLRVKQGLEHICPALIDESEDTQQYAELSRTMLECQARMLSFSCGSESDARQIAYYVLPRPSRTTGDFSPWQLKYERCNDVLENNDTHKPYTIPLPTKHSTLAKDPSCFEPWMIGE